MAGTFGTLAFFFVMRYLYLLAFWVILQYDVLQVQVLSRPDLLVGIIFYCLDIKHLLCHFHEPHVRSSPLLETEVAHGIVPDQVT
jgi:hypothetical protein